jgi:hypothetical protein
LDDTALLDVHRITMALKYIKRFSSKSLFHFQTLLVLTIFLVLCVTFWVKLNDENSPYNEYLSGNNLIVQNSNLQIFNEVEEDIHPTPTLKSMPSELTGKIGEKSKKTSIYNQHFSKHGNFPFLPMCSPVSPLLGMKCFIHDSLCNRKY